MSLICDKTVKQIDTTAISPGDLVYIEREGWKEPRKGVVLTVSSTSIQIQYRQETGGALNHFDVTAEELGSESYTFRWSEDLQTIHSHTEEAGDES